MKKLILLTSALLAINSQAGLISSAKCYFKSMDEIHNEISEQTTKLDRTITELMRTESARVFKLYTDALIESGESIAFAISCAKDKGLFETEKENIIKSTETITNIADQLGGVDAAPKFIIEKLARGLKLIEDSRARLDLQPHFESIEITK